ncbi:MAG: phosphopyruvate hydratase [bacterium]
MINTIEHIYAREILDSRGNPTVCVDVILDNGKKGVSAVPSGASAGIHEALELRDNNMARYLGKGVKNAVENINNIIARELKGKSILDQENIDNLLIDLDGTHQKSYLGANAILGVSMACIRAHAVARNMELFKVIADIYGNKKDYFIPTPMVNIINGGKHADTNLNFQEFMVVPASDIDYKEQLRLVSEVFHTLATVMKLKKLDTDTGNEGGYAPDVKSNEQPLELLCETFDQMQYEPGKDVFIAMDVAASTFYNPGDKNYHLSVDNKKYSVEQMISLYKKFVNKYPIVSIEDPLNEDDFSGWANLRQKLGENIMIVGDDIFVTNVERLKQGVEKGSANSVIIKPNQVGTITETFNCIRFARDNGITTVVSHRSGETIDDTIADIAVGTGSEFIKAGSCAHGERVAKYNRLLLIEEKIKKDAE